MLRAVVDATNQIGNQEALELARAVDPDGLRTVGVLTKCDVVQRGDEKRVRPRSNRDRGILLSFANNYRS